MSDKIANVRNEPEVKEALNKQYVELKSLKAIVESKIHELDHTKTLFNF